MMTNNNNKPKKPTSEEIVLQQQQQQIIESQRNQIKDLTQRLEFAQDMNREYQELRTLFAQNPGANWSQVQSTIMTRQNALVQAERQQRDYERRTAMELEETTRREAQEKAIIDENPSLMKYFQDQKAKIGQTKEYMTDKVKEFYSLEDDDIYEYASLPHGPDNSAVKHLLQIYEHEKGFLVYQCRYCEEEFSQLGKFEIHCYSHDQAEHRSRLLKSIEDEARQNIAKANAELQKDINDVIKAKANAAARAQLAKQRAEESRLKKDLPYVQKQ